MLLSSVAISSPIPYTIKKITKNAKKHCNHKNTQYTNIYEKNKKKCLRIKIKKKKHEKLIASNFIILFSLSKKGKSWNFS